MKTEPMEHQVKGIARLEENPDFFALAAEQGTGKTWMLLYDAEQQYQKGRIEALFILAPKGVHSNWILREIPKHFDVPTHRYYWLAGSTKKKERAIKRLMNTDPKREMPIMAMNIDAINTPTGYSAAAKFLKKFRCAMVVDESQRIKNPDSKRTQKAIKLGQLAPVRRIASGTLIADRGPLDAFSQFEFLRPGLLGTTSYRAFVAEYAELLKPDHPVYQEAVKRAKGRRANPQIVATDREGRPMYKNVSKLAKMMAPYTFRVLKDDCLDLPDKVYKQQFFELEPAHKRFYDKVKQEKRLELQNGDINVMTALTVINKLRQITSGFVIEDEGPAELRWPKQRLSALKEILADVEGKVIIWASFREEIRQLEEALKDYRVVCYHGGVSGDDREAAVDEFQNGDAEIFLANPAAAGVGLTLTSASTAIYYSCDYSLENRLQSEDRCHRIGTKDTVVYYDLVGAGTIDEKIANSLQTKNDIATELMRNL